MQFRNLRTTSKPRLMIIPMIDIIFFLLVFFMMSMLSMVVQRSMPVQLPAASAGAADLQKKIPITITSDGTLYIEDKKSTIDGMARYMQAEQAKGEDVTVIVRADTHAQYGMFVNVLDTLKKLKITKIAVATEAQ
ncbi:MAG: biopolymer transporter ExbD [Veillonellaceae bacterium]|nr:biopolymer transporter ExbD [Veillonellaceae bacterium]